MDAITFLYITGMVYMAGAFGFYLTENLLFLIFMLLFPIVFVVDIWAREKIAFYIDKLTHHEFVFFDKWLHHVHGG
jgi:hypothetical protein